MDKVRGRFEAGISMPAQFAYRQLYSIGPMYIGNMRDWALAPLGGNSGPVVTSLYPPRCRLSEWAGAPDEHPPGDKNDEAATSDGGKLVCAFNRDGGYWS